MEIAMSLVVGGLAGLSVATACGVEPRVPRMPPAELARQTLESMAEIAIYIIGGNSKDGLRKNDKPWNINSDGRYLFSFRKLETTLDPREYATGHTRDDAIRLTKDMEEILRKEAGKEGN